jgi:peptide/nickel transport system permease protein
MTKYIFKRILALIPVMLVVATVVFILMRLLPGNPAAMMLGPEATAEEIARLAAEMGLNKPIPVQMVEWFASILKGDLGTSIFMRMPVTEAIVKHMEATLLLTFLALFMSVVLGITAGVISASRHNSILDQFIMFLSSLGVAIPNFWLALMLVLYVALNSSFFPVAYYEPISKAGLFNSIRFLLLPAFALGAGQAAIIARMTRASMLEVLQNDYIRTAKAKGVAGSLVIFKHALKNAIIPTITIIGLCFANLMGGAVVTEQVFSIPGIGRLLITGVLRRDYPLISGIVLYVAAAYVIINLLIDIVYVYLDPRIKL